MNPLETHDEKRPRQIQKIALVHKHMKAGGVEALVVRMARWLVDNDYDVSVYLYSNGGPLLRHLQQIEGLEIIVRDNGKEPPVDWSVLQRLVRSDSYDLVYSFGPTGLLLSYAIPAKLRLSGVYQPETYNRERNRKIIRAIRAFDKNFSDKLVFMNPTVRRMTEQALDMDMPEQFMPAPIEPISQNAKLGNPSSRRIVSVGTIHRFTTHYAQVIELMEELIRIDPAFTYHIYGEGPDKDRLRKSIDESDARNHIFLHPMPRQMVMESILTDSLCFIGSGALMIQACQAGIPGITSRTNDADGLSEGFFYELPPYEVGESFWEASETYEIGELVKHLLTSETTYQQVVKHCREKACQFQIDTVFESFLSFAEEKMSVALEK